MSGAASSATAVQEHSCKRQELMPTPCKPTLLMHGFPLMQKYGGGGRRGRGGGGSSGRYDAGAACFA